MLSTAVWESAKELTVDENLKSLVGRTLVGIDGHKIGRIDAIYVNSRTGEPEWAAISLGGLLATKLTFVPVARVTQEGDHALVDFDKKFVKNALSTHTEGVLDPAENEALHRYYGIAAPAEFAGSHDAALGIR
jgi:sporulation protein YlmC with PRC-barrel domain